jgi:hypothetical protein
MLHLPDDNERRLNVFDCVCACRYNNWAGLLMAGLGRQGGDDAKHARLAEAALRKATSLNPTHANAWENWAILHDGFGRTAEAKAARSEARKAEKLLGDEGGGAGFLSLDGGDGGATAVHEEL